MGEELTCDDFYNNIKAELRRSVPQFAFDEDDEVYRVMFEFSQYLLEHIGKEEVLRRCCAFINDAVMRGGNATMDVTVLQVFAYIYDRSFYREHCKKYFHKDVIPVFELYFEYYLQYNTPES